MKREAFDDSLERKAIVAQLQAAMGCRVITYICSDRQGGQLAQIAEDVLPVVYEHLELANSGVGAAKPDVAFYIYSRGGRADVPWKLVTLFRQMSGRFIVIVPYRAHSAATMIAIGADAIHMHPMGELSPIDPALELGSNQLPVEDVAAYLRFLRDRAGLSDQGPMSALMVKLTEALGPTLLGRIEREYSHVRLVASKLLAQQKAPVDPDKASRIIDALTEKCYVHDHAIRQPEARELGLPAEFLTGESSSLTWRLYQKYEDALKLTVNPKFLLPPDGASLVENDLPIAFVESEEMCHAFVGTCVTRRAREMPPECAISLTVNISEKVAEGLGISKAQVDEIAQRLLPGIQQQAARILSEATLKEKVVTQFAGKWVRLE